MKRQIEDPCPANLPLVYKTGYKLHDGGGAQGHMRRETDAKEGKERFKGDDEYGNGYGPSNNDPRVNGCLRAPGAYLEQPSPSLSKNPAPQPSGRRTDQEIRPIKHVETPSARQPKKASGSE